jgi:hypothetical protein
MARKPFGSKALNPRYGNNLIDAHFLDALEGDEAEAVARILELCEAKEFILLIPYSVKAEIDHEHTPQRIKDRARQFLFTEEVQLTQPELDRVEAARTLMRGNGFCAPRSIT